MAALLRKFGLRSGAGKDASEQQRQQQMERLQSLCESLATDNSGSTALLALLDKLQDGLASVENMPVHQAQAVHSASRSYRYSTGGKFLIKYSLIQRHLCRMCLMSSS